MARERTSYAADLLECCKARYYGLDDVDSSSNVSFEVNSKVSDGVVRTGMIDILLIQTCPVGMRC